MKRSKLTWDAVADVVGRAGPRGLTNRQIAGALGAASLRYDGMGGVKLGGWTRLA